MRFFEFEMTGNSEATFPNQDISHLIEGVLSESCRKSYVVLIELTAGPLNRSNPRNATCIILATGSEPQRHVLDVSSFKLYHQWQGNVSVCDRFCHTPHIRSKKHDA